MLKPGNIVKIINRTLEYSEAFGKVIETKEEDETGNTICVEICKAFSYLGGAYFAQTRRQWYKPEQLEKHEDYPSEIKAKNLFDRTFMAVNVLTTPFKVGVNNCEHEGCLRKINQRIMFNIHGSVYEADVCDKHAKDYHGHLIDHFPWKKSA